MKIAKRFLSYDPPPYRGGVKIAALSFPHGLAIRGSAQFKREAHMSMKEITIIPSQRPRDLADALISASVGCLQLAVIVGIPCAAVYLLTGGGGYSFVAGVIAAAAFSLFSVKSIAVGPEGISVRRVLGSPRFLLWATIHSVREVSRSELIHRGWLWPLFPAREMTTSFTSLGHYRISYGNDCFYYPPADPVEFMALVRAHLDERS